MAHKAMSSAKLPGLANNDAVRERKPQTAATMMQSIFIIRHV